MVLMGRAGGAVTNESVVAEGEPGWFGNHGSAVSLSFLGSVVGQGAFTKHVGQFPGVPWAIVTSIEPFVVTGDVVDTSLLAVPGIQLCEESEGERLRASEMRL